MKTRKVDRYFGLLVIFLAGLLASPRVGAQTGASAVGVEERLGTIIPPGLVFTDAERREVDLRELIDKPTIINLVYIRCPSICSPLMNELATMVEKVEMNPGQDYQVLTVSFDHREHDPEYANLIKNGKRNLLGRIPRTIPPTGWRFLTGTRESIARLCDLVGFGFAADRDGNYTHPATTIFLSSQGKVVRYLHGVQLLPANVELALVDAMAGRERSTMRSLQKLCFSYDPAGKTYVLQINRIILVASLVLIAAFLGFLFLSRRRVARAAEGGGK